MFVSILFVRAEFVATAPKVFQAYIAEYFKKSSFLGQTVFSAVRQLEDSDQRGFAPCHEVDLRRFKQDLPRGLSLNEWIRRQSRHDIEEVSIPYDDSPVTHC